MVKDAPRRQLQLEQRRVVPPAHGEHALVEQAGAALVALQDAGADLGGLVGLVGAGHEGRPAPARAGGAEHLLVALGGGGAGQHRVGDGEHLGDRAVVVLEHDDVGPEAHRELQDVADVSRRNR